MKFVWDPRKAKSNFKKHGVHFDEAVTVFYDNLSKLATDPDSADIENRYILVGFSRKSRLLFVVHLYQVETEIIRIISARKATKKEKRDFEEL